MPAPSNAKAKKYRKDKFALKFAVAKSADKTDQIVDWEAIEGAFRAGILSIRMIAKSHGITDTAIRKRAKSDGWERDLSDKVRSEVRNQLVRGPVRSKKPEREIIEEHAATQVSIVREHQVSLRNGHQIAEAMLAELREVYDHQDEIETDIDADTEKERSKERRDRMLRAVALPSRSSVLVNLASALKSLIGLERQAFNLDAAADSSQIDILDIISASHKATA